jgi:hypothetical protein
MFVTVKVYIYAFSDSVNGDSNHPKKAVDLSTDTYFCSQHHPNQSIGCDFKDNQTISPIHFTIRSVVGD